MIQFINPNTVGGKTYYDVILKGDGWSSRINISTHGEDLEELGQRLFDQEAARFHNEKNKAEVLAALDSFAAVVKSKVEAGQLGLEHLSQMNALINTNLSSIGVTIDTPTITSILAGRIAQSIELIREAYKRTDVTDEIKDNSFALLSTLNGNA